MADLLTGVVTRSGHIDHENVDLLASVRRFESCRSGGSQDAIVLLADSTPRFVLTRA